MSTPLAIGALIAVLGFFAYVGVARVRHTGSDDFFVARSSQSVRPLTLSLYASGMGVWILFTPPIVAAFTGILGVVAYALAAAAPLLAFGLLGSRVRRQLPSGITLTDWVRLRHGRAFQAYVSVVAVFYMFMFLTAELTAIGQVLTLPGFGGTPAWVGIVGTAAVTAAYTSYGGLRASLRTDRWQSWLILGLLAVGLAAILVYHDNPSRLAVDGGLTVVNRAGFEAIAVLVIAVTAANLFHHGYWQRMWAASNERTLRLSTSAAAVLTFLTVFAVGFTGLLAAGLGDPAVPFFDLLTGLPLIVRVFIVVLAVALVASSVDTLENGMAVAVARDITAGRLSTTVARWVTIALVVPAAFIAIQGHDILRLFLIADLVAAATVGPVFLGLGRRISGSAAFAGSVSGLVAVFIAGVITRGGVAGGWALVTIADAPSLDLPAFALALLISMAVALAWPVARDTRTRSSARPGHGPERGLMLEDHGDSGAGRGDLGR